MTADPWAGNARRRRRLVVLTLTIKGTVCHLCGLPGADSADHLIPRAKGGPVWDPRNLAPAHRGCNSARQDMDLDEWRRRHPLPTRPRLTPSRSW